MSSSKVKKLYSNMRDYAKLDLARRTVIYFLARNFYEEEISAYHKYFDVFDPDSRGMVPVLTPGRVTDSPTATEYYWSLLYPTPVAGLFVRADDAILGHIHYTIVAGSGYKLVGDFWERAYADELAVKLGNAMPGLDWFQVSIGTLTTELKQTAVEIIREHGRWRPEPTTREETGA